ncbi:glycosyltransferase family 39 protein [Pelagibacteraceae bacterium]|nr:glycosyltransferase family 39 protein [Pelagibacteraceae bacterium]
MKLKTNFDYLIIGFFLIYFLIGHYIFRDYLVTPDEPLHRINGFISLKYILKLFFNSSIYIEQLKDIPELYNDWRKTYGTVFDLPLSWFELVYKLNIQESFLLRHYLIFLIFFISNIFFFNLLKANLKSEKLALLGVAILITSPRIFSHSFYNGKDILFLSLMIIATYYCIRLLKKYSFKNLLLACIFCAFASNIRIIGIYLPILTFIFYFFLENNLKTKKNFYFFIAFFLIYFIILYIIWPFLWLNPIENFLLILKESSSYPNHWNFKILYLGNYLNPENLPWHYFFIWFLSTTPVVFVVIIFFGLFIFSKDYLQYLLKIDFNKKIKLWLNAEQMVNLFIFLCFFFPIFFVITLNSTLYNGWRHLYFLYPFLIYLSLYGLSYIFRQFRNIFKKLIYLLICLQVISNSYFIYKAHPVQNIYFNFLSKNYIEGNLPVDYWGLGNKKTIDFLLSKKKNISISTSSFTPLINLRYSDSSNFSYTENIKFYGTQKNYKNVSDFIFTNYYFNRDPKNVEKYKIYENYKSYYKLIINNITVNEVFAK